MAAWTSRLFGEEFRPQDLSKCWSNASITISKINVKKDG